MRYLWSFLGFMLATTAFLSNGWCPFIEPGPDKKTWHYKDANGETSWITDAKTGQVLAGPGDENLAVFNNMAADSPPQLLERSKGAIDDPQTLQRFKKLGQQHGQRQQELKQILEGDGPVEIGDDYLHCHLDRDVFDHLHRWITMDNMDRQVVLMVNAICVGTRLARVHSDVEASSNNIESIRIKTLDEFAISKEDYPYGDVNNFPKSFALPVYNADERIAPSQTVLEGLAFPVECWSNGRLVNFQTAQVVAIELVKNTLADAL